MSKSTKILAALVLSGSLAGCVSPDPQVQNVAGGAALGAAASAIAGGNQVRSLQAALLVPQQARLSPTNQTFRFFRTRAVRLQTTCERRFARIGQGGVFAFQIAQKGLPHVQ
jgi:hypothetical protein